ncbi:hypothetical protein BG844_18905 [Couchioplanes caeruleus subsp. caeruleus]|uniref:DUF488 domain-containing protein n=2 Tax=Couchioplanes caeruleus TaxID=56438 RepID=A0A1K0GTX1_9ACTN|nr:hypothetical protein BG844_18905 [Couchioplanes caeruleus subsp. caeruleus]
MGSPVRTTVGYPRFTLPYELAGHARLISPTWAMVSISNEATYRGQYRQQLDAHGVDAVCGELHAIADQASDPRLVLLCFDDLSKPDGWCHRRMFADWWTELTGDDVPELAEPPIASLF